MKDRALNRLFLRFKEKADGAALAAVFDATAREFLEVASHLIRDPTDAEDLVQSTFQVAIEKCQSFRGGMQLKAWLYGILWREAAKMRRRAARAVDPDRLPVRTVTGPLDRIVAREIPVLVEDALSKLPSTYRVVLEPLIREGLQPHEIARDLGRAPGTVRMQIHRGMGRLRQALPSGISQVGAGLLLAPHGLDTIRGLDAIRTEVLRHANLTGPGALAPSATTLALKVVAGGATTWASFALVATLLVAGALGSVLSSRSEAKKTPAPADASSVARTLEAPRAAPDRRLATSALPTTNRSRKEAAKGPPGTGAPVDVRGIVLDEDGRPVPDVKVQAILTDAGVGPGRTSSTTPEGTFGFSGLRDGSWSFVVDDERYARMWRGEHVRELPPAEQDEEQELVLLLYAPRTLSGQVMNETGSTVQDITVALAREWLGESDRPLQPALEPLARTRTTDEGRYVLERLRPGRVQLVLSGDGYAPTLATAAVDVEEHLLTIERGLTLYGRVVTGDLPLSGVRVLGSSPALAAFQLGSFAAVTRDSGDFEIEGISALLGRTLEGSPAALVTLEDPAWRAPRYRVSERSPRVLPYLTIRATPEGATHALAQAPVDATDEAPGALALPVESAGRLHVRLSEGPFGADTESAPTAYLTALDSGAATFRHRRILGRGVAVFEDLPPGRYRIRVRNANPNYLAREVLVRPGASLDVQLHQGRAALVGNVRSGARRVRGGTITLRRTAGTLRRTAGTLRRTAGTLRRTAGPGAFATARVHDDGSYAALGLAPGEYELTYSPPLGMACRFVVPVESDCSSFDLELPTGRIDGVLSGEALGAGRGADRFVRVAARSTHPSLLSSIRVPVDEARHFRVDYLQPGSYSLSTLDEQGRWLSELVRITERDPQVRVELRRRGSGTIQGEVIGPTSFRNAPSASVLHAFPRDEHGYDASRARAVELDPRTGSFRIDGLRAGTWGLRYLDHQSQRPFAWAPDIVVGAGETHHTRVVVPRGRGVRVTLDDPGFVVPELRWRIRLPGNDWLSWQTVAGVGSSARSATVPLALPPGDYLIEMEGVQGRTTQRRFTVVLGEEVLEVRLGRSAQRRPPSHAR